MTSLEQAKRFYPLFAVIGNLAPIVSGKIMTTVIKRYVLIFFNFESASGETIIAGDKSCDCLTCNVLHWISKANIK